MDGLLSPFRGWNSFAFVLLALAFMSPAMADPSLIGQWRLDEGTGTTTADASGHSLTGTLANGPTWTTGKVGNGVNFSAGSGYVGLGTAPITENLYQTGMTVSAWINPRSLGASGGRIVDKNNTSAGWSLFMNSTSSVRFVGDQFATAAAIRNSTNSIALNTWQHVAVTWDGSTNGANIHIYINGVLADSGSSNGSGVASSDATVPLTIGNRQSDLARGFDGVIDEVHLYNRVLSASEVQALADATAPSAPASLTATAASSSQINLSWPTASDNVAVTGYLVERCQGTSCTNFSQIATPTSNSYSDTGLSAATTYRYRVRATDAAGNLGSYGPIGSATTSAGPAGPVGYWHLDEGSGTSTADSSGNGITGTLTNGPSWTTGKIGNGVNFTANTAYVGMGAPAALANLNLTGMTVSAWINPRSVGASGGRIVDKNNTAAGWSLFMNSTNTLRFVGDAFATAAIRNSTASVALNTWQNVVATWDGTTSGAGIHIYINGVAADGGSSDGSGATASDSAVQLAIGNRQSDAARGFDGVIDEVRVYNRILTLTEIQALADTQAPTAPASLTATTASSSQINLSWPAATDNVGVTGYRVERCQGTSCTTFTQVATPTGASYNDTGLSPSTTYRYRVRAVDAAGNAGSYSPIANATTTSGGGGDVTPPTAPSGLTATAASSSQINLSWTGSSDNVGVTGYRVERCQGSGCSTFAEIASPSTTTFSDSGLSASTSYSYRVRATDAVPNFSSYSNTASATTGGGGDVVAPSTPTGLLVVAAGSTEIDLAWNASTDNVGVTGYIVERCQGASCTSWAQVATPTATFFNDTGRSASTSYSYRVKARDAASNISSPSSTVTYVTPANTPDCK